MRCRRNEQADLVVYMDLEGPCEPLSQLLVSSLITPIVVPYIIPYITPFKEFRL